MDNTMFMELNELELCNIDGGAFWDVFKDAAVGAIAGAVTGFVKGVVTGALVGLTCGVGGVIAGAVSCGLYYAGKGAVVGAISNVSIQYAADVFADIAR